MATRSVDEVLAGSAAPVPDSRELDAALFSLVDEARSQAGHQQRTSRRRRVFLLPAVVVAGALLTAGAVVASVSFDPQVRVPVEYVTDAGTEVSCTYAMTVGSIASGQNKELRDWVMSHDWDGFGQSVYHSARLQSSGDDAGTSADLAAKFRFLRVLLAQLEDAMPTDLINTYKAVNGLSSCSGQLH